MTNATPRHASVQVTLENAIRKLVERERLACGFESGLCRYCLSRVEHPDPHMIEPHRPDCPWQRVRSHYFPGDKPIELTAKHAA